MIVGKGLPTPDKRPKCFGFVSRYEPEPERRLAEWLKGQGLQSNQPVTFLSDGGDTVRELPMGLHPKSEHLLDWFHVTMRLTGMSRLATGMQAEAHPGVGRRPRGHAGAPEVEFVARQGQSGLGNHR